MSAGNCLRQRLWRGLAITAVTVAVSLPCGAMAKVFRSAETHPEDYPTTQAVITMGRLLAERSGGAHSLHVFHSRQLGEEKETIEQTRLGAIDFDRVNVAPFNDLVPETRVLSLPFLFRSVEHLHRVLDGPVGAEILAAFERYGFIALAFYDSGPRSFYTRKVVRMLPDDFAGLRIRVQQSLVFTRMIEALGAQPRPMPYGEVLTALRTGIIDGAENDWPSYEESLHYRWARTYILSRHAMAPEVLVMSKAVWDVLDDEDRRLIRWAALESVAVQRRLWAERQAVAEERVRAAGISVVDVDREAMAAVLRPRWPDMLSDARLMALVHRIEAVE